MILCLGTTPAVQRVMVFDRLEVNEVNRAARTLDGVAGKSINVAKVLRALGGRPFATGFLGGDRGAFVRAVLDEHAIPHEFVDVPARTRQCVTVIDRAQRTVTELVEESLPVDASAFAALAEIFDRHWPRARAVVLSGTITPGGPETLYADCVRKAQAHSGLTVVDAKGPPLLAALGEKPGLVKPNRSELAATVGRSLDDETAIIQALRELHERGAQRIVVTAGKDPSLAFDGTRFWRVGNPPIDAVNPIGSGDSFTAGVVLGLLAGDDLGEACRRGAAAGAANALNLLAGEVGPGEVERLAARVNLAVVGG